jgi:hypothetical protein
MQSESHPQMDGFSATSLNFDFDETATHGRSLRDAFVKLPDAIQTLSSEGICLRWDQNSCCYEVLNGELFKQKVSELQSLCGQRKGHEVGGPFGMMHAYFTMVHGERWEEIGTVFRPKGMDIPQSGFWLDPVLAPCNKQIDGEYMPATSTYYIADNRPFHDIGWNHIPHRLSSSQQHHSDNELSISRPAQSRDDDSLDQVVHSRSRYDERACSQAHSQVAHGYYYFAGTMAP